MESGVQGFVRLSIVVLGPGDVPTGHLDEDDEEEV